MKVKILKSIIVQDAPGAKVGQILDLPAGVASYLVSDRLAEFVEDGQILTREPVVETRDPQPAETQPVKLFGRRKTK